MKLKDRIKSLFSKDPKIEQATGMMGFQNTTGILNDVITATLFTTKSISEIVIDLYREIQESDHSAIDSEVKRLTNIQNRTRRNRIKKKLQKRIAKLLESK